MMQTLSLKWMLRTIAVLLQLFLTKALVILCNTTHTGIISYNQPIELRCNAFSSNAVYQWTSTKFKQPKVTGSIVVKATNDSVEYTCTVTGSNQNASIYVFSVDDDICLSSPLPKAVHGNSNKASVEGRVITFSCEFKGRHSLSRNYNYIFKWIITLQNGTSITVAENSSNSDYYICTQQTFRDCHCYYYRTELYVPAIRSLDKAQITCIAVYEDNVSSPNSSFLRIIELPRLIIEPTSAIGVKEYESVEFKCGFSAPAIPYLVICEWLKDGYPISNANKHPTTDPKSNITICSFNINSVSPRDEGNYYCSICYNKSFGDQFNFPEDEIIKSKSAMAVLQLESHEDKRIIIAATIPVVAVVVYLITSFLHKKWDVCRNNPVIPPEPPLPTEIVDDQAPLLTTAQPYGAISPRNVETPTIQMNYVRFVTQPKAENIVLTGDKLELSCRADGVPGMTLEYYWLKYSERDSSQGTYTGHSRNKMIIPVSSNIDEGYYVCEVIACQCERRKGMVRSEVAHVIVVDSKNINFVKQPPSEVDIKLGEKLTLECQAWCGSYSVKYQWYKGSDLLADATQPVLTIPSVSETDIGSYNCVVTSDFSVEEAVSKTTEVKINNTSSIESQVYDQVSDTSLNESQVYDQDQDVDQRTISQGSGRSKESLSSAKEVWFDTHPKAENIVLTGNKLELSCRADGAPGIMLEYHWFKCTRDGSQGKSTGHSSNKMIIPVCSNINEGYYVCEAIACQCERQKGMVRSEVAHVIVVDSNNINFVKQPPGEVDIKLGEELTLECLALCGSYSVNYQWYKGSDQLAGATQSVLTIPSVSEADIGSYNCIVTSDFSVERAVSKTTEVKRPSYLHQILIQEPEMGDIIAIVIPRIQAEWDDVAYSLGYKIATVNAIKAKNHDNPKKCCKELFIDWLSSGHGVGPKTWSTLIEKLKKIEELAAATNEIMNELEKL